jgi:MarR family transcriptional regulator, organic hydroperoxide resistance regulator
MLRVGMAAGDQTAEREENLGGLLARASHLLSAGFSPHIKGHGISATAWRILGALAERDGLTMTELADLVLFKQPTLTKAIDRMERDQLVQRRTPTEDRRRTLVYLTDRGHRAATPLVQRARQHDASVARAIGDTAYQDLKSALSALIRRLSEQDLPARARTGTLRR